MEKLRVGVRVAHPVHLAEIGSERSQHLRASLDARTLIMQHERLGVPMSN